MPARTVKVSARFLPNSSGSSMHHRFSAPRYRRRFCTAAAALTKVAVVVLSIIMILAMTASQFITQKQIMAKNMSAEAMQSPFMKQQQMMLYILPLVFGIGGINFPIGVLIYWTTTNIWTMAQQFFVIRRMPTPGSQAARELADRRAKKGLPMVPLLGERKTEEPAVEAPAEPKGQRHQPQRKNRKRK